MRIWEKFKSLKLRGEWVELEFMAAAALHGYHVLKPWGDSLDYGIAVEHADCYEALYKQPCALYILGHHVVPISTKDKL